MYSYLSFLHIVHWIDILEIGLFSSCIFFFCRWLKQDRQSNRPCLKLLSYFYLGCAGFVSAYVFDLYAVVQFYTYSWPALIMLFIIVHQKSLQKNYVAARTIKPTQQADLNTWLQIMISTAFKSIQYKKDLIFIIEGKNNLDDFVTSTTTFNAPIQKQLCNIIVESSLCKSKSQIIITQHGTLRTISSGWKKEIDHVWLDNKTKTYAPWEQEALYWCTHLDALIFYIEPTTKKCTIIAQGNRVPHLSLEKAMSIIAQYIRKSSLSLQKNTSEKGATL